MVDDNEPPLWYQERLDSLVQFGFDQDTMAIFLNEDPEHLTERLTWMEVQRDMASDLEDRIISFQNMKEVEYLDFEPVKDLLRDVFGIEDALRIYEQLLRDIAPWEAVLERHKQAWFEQEEGGVWNDLYRRLSALDPSSIPSVNLLHPLFTQPERFGEIQRHLQTIEADEERQRRVMAEGAEALRSKGFDVPFFDKLSLMDALNELEEWQSFHHLSERVRLAILQFITPFDSTLSEAHEQRRQNYISLNEAPQLEELSNEILQLGQTLETRRLEMSMAVDHWRQQGIIFPHEGELQPSELMEWETNIDVIERSVQEHLNLVERWGYFSQRWPSHAASSESYVGHLEQTSELKIAVDELDQLWKQTELDALAFIGAFEQVGMVLDDWRNRIIEDPLNTMDLLSHQRPMWERCVSLLDSLEALDVSFEGKEDVDARCRMLREIECGGDVLHEMERFVEDRTRRNSRHRVMLENELSRLRIADAIPLERHTESMSLGEFEHYVGTLLRGESYETSASEQGRLAPRILERLSEELDQLHTDGWLIQEWRGLFAKKPLFVARQLSLARPHIHGHAALRRRLSLLPWNRDVQLGLDVESRLRQPSKLHGLHEQIPMFASRLAQREVEDEAYTLALWQPILARPTLVPVAESISRTPVIEQNESPLDDAHEAMLEAMEAAPGEGAVEETVEVVPIQRAEETIQVKTIEDIVVSEEREEVDLNAEVENIEPVIAQTIKELPKSAERHKAVTPHGAEGGLKALADLLKALGMTLEAQEVEENGLEAIPSTRRALASQVNITPRDIRLARLLRIALRCLPEGDSSDALRASILTQLTTMTRPLKTWMRHRLEARHSGASGDMLVDAEQLAKALMRIPGPGRRIPLEKDEWVLPTDLNELTLEVKRLGEAVQLPSAGGVQA